MQTRALSCIVISVSRTVYALACGQQQPCTLQLTSMVALLKAQASSVKVSLKDH